MMVIATMIGAAAMWHALANRRVRTWSTWIAWTAFVGCTALAMIPRAYSVKQFLSTGWPFVILFLVWSLTDGGHEEARPDRALRLGPAAPAAGGRVVVDCRHRRSRRAARRLARRRGVSECAGVQHGPGEPTRLAVWLDPVWNSGPYDYYRPTIAAPATNPLASADSLVGRDAPATDVCLVAERFGKSPPTSPSEAWLERHLRLVDVVPFARLELRCYTNRGADRRSGFGAVSICT